MSSSAILSFPPCRPDQLRCDYPDHRRAWQVTLDTMESLTRFRGMLGAKDAKTPDEHSLKQVLARLVEANPLPDPMAAVVKEPLSDRNSVLIFQPPTGVDPNVWNGLVL